MEEIHPGDLVSIETGGPRFDAIVFDVPSPSKVVVATVDPKRGPVFRSVHPRELTERGEEGPGDKAMRQLMQRTPLPDHHAARGAKGGGRGRQGFGRGADHRHASR
jgi:hypothetical protein